MLGGRGRWVSEFKASLVYRVRSGQNLYGKKVIKKERKKERERKGQERGKEGGREGEGKEGEDHVQLYIYFSCAF